MKYRVLAAALAGAVVLAGGVTRAQTDDALRIAIEGAYPPFSWVEPDGTFAGFDIDIAIALCAEMDRECELVQQDWDGMIPALLAERFDAIVASMSITEERRQHVDFSIKYYHTPGVVVAEADSAIELTAEDLAGRRIGLQRATIYQCYAEKYFPDAELVLYPSQEEVFQDLAAGRLEAQISDVIAASDSFLETDSGAGFAVIGYLEQGDICLGEGAGVAVRKGEEELREAFSAAILAIRANGIYTEINDKYFAFDIFGND